MNLDKVLIAEDEPISAAILEKTVKLAGFTPYLVENGEAALELYRREPFHLLLVDLEMPRMGGLELIDRIKEMGDEPAIIVQTANTDLSTAIQVMKKGVYDYVIKPIHSEELGVKLEKASEYLRLKEMQKALERESEIRLERQLSLNILKEDILTRDADRFDKNLFHNLKQSFSQGAGFGLLLTLLSLIDSSARKDGEEYVINAELMELIKINSKVAHRALEIFGEIESLVSEVLQTESVSLQGLYELIQEIIAESQPLAEIKNQTVKLSDAKPEYSHRMTRLHLGFIKKAFSEILLNAYKFSPENSEIFILLNADARTASINFINTPVKTREGSVGIPGEYERLVLEPFFRLGRGVDDRYSSLDFGLGLTLAAKIIKKHEGGIHLGNVVEHFSRSSDSGIAVSVRLELPLEE